MLAHLKTSYRHTSYFSVTQSQHECKKIKWEDFFILNAKETPVQFWTRCGRESCWRNVMQKQFVMKGSAARYQTPVRQEGPFKRHSIHTWHSIPDKFSPFCMNNMHWSKINICSLICCKLTVVTWPIYGVFLSGFSVLVKPFLAPEAPEGPGWDGWTSGLKKILFEIPTRQKEKLQQNFVAFAPF